MGVSHWMMSRREHLQASVELTEHELRWLWYIPNKDQEGISMTPVIFKVISLPQGIIEQGEVRKPTELTRILEKCLKEQGVKGRVNVRIGIPFANSFIREYTLPWVEKRERTHLLNYLADEEIPISVNERFIDSFVTELKSSPKRLRVVLSGIRKSVLSGIVTSFEAAGFSIESIGFSLLAWARVLDFGPEEHTLLIKEQRGMIQLIFYRGQIPEITRVIPPAAKYYGVEEWSLEIQRILAYFSSLHEEVEIQRVVVSQGVETESLGRRVCAYLSLEKGLEPSFQLLEGAIPSLPQIENCLDPDQLLAVTGMALVAGRNFSNNFRREENQRKIGQRNKWIAAMVLFALTLTGLGLRVSILKTMEALDREIFQLRATGENLKLIGSRQEEQARSWNDLAKSPTTVGRDLTVLESLTRKELQFDRLEVKEGSLMIQGKASEAVLVKEILNQLPNLGWEKAQLRNYHLDQNQESEAGEIKFTLVAERVRK